MDVNVLRAAVAVGGLVVLVSYVVGILRAPAPDALWGGLGPNLRMTIVPFMLLAAAGFLFAAWLLLVKWSPDQIAGLYFPGGVDDGDGVRRLFLAYALYLIPSALWLESTLLHLRVGSGATQALTIGVLSLVTVGLLLLAGLAMSAMHQGLPHAKWLLASVVVMAIQSTFWDNLVWVAKFPW